LPRPIPALIAAALAALLCLPLVGMGPWGEDSPDTRIPEPAINYRLQVRDTELNVFDVSRASIDGEVYVTGKMGEAKISVPFDKIESVWFERAEPGLVAAIVTLKGGEQMKALTMDGRTPCFGEAAYGHVRIELQHIRDVKVIGRVP